MYYTSEGPNVKRFNVCNNTQMPDFNSAPLPDPVGGAQQFSLLPGGGMLVADFNTIARLDASGNLVRTYDAPANNCLARHGARSRRHIVLGQQLVRIVRNAFSTSRRAV